MNQTDIKQQVREFYDQVGWQEISEGLYQNTHYEDLRPVSHEYIHRCHLRLLRHLKPTGRFLLDAGSGPIQYPEYLTYSQGYQRRVCADISVTALKEARARIGEHGLFVVADIANLPFKTDAFEAVVSLHTIHHLPEGEHLQAYRELFRALSPGCRAAVVNGWPASRMMSAFEPLMRFSRRLRSAAARMRGEPRPPRKVRQNKQDEEDAPKGTFTKRHDYRWVQQVVGAEMPLDILVWRSVSVRFLRTLIHPWLGGRYWLRLLYWVEERYPRYFGEVGQYPLIVIQKD
ncbi:MAG: class I SAM-dependent methyltransferase [Anaerolineales bacterium]